jgi:hypothetical protein
MLRLSTVTPPTSSFDDQINLATGLSASDEVSVLEHEITEGGMGRIGGLGGKNYLTLSGASQANIWGAPDLFRYANGAYDRNANDTTYFSDNGGSTISSLAFFNGNNANIPPSDTADFESDATGKFGANDVFGGGVGTFSQTDYQMMGVLGWEPILPELEIKSSSLKSSIPTVTTGDAISLSATVENYGATSAGAFQTQFYISTSKIFDSTAIAIGSPISTASLAAGATVTLSETATVPNITSGTDYLFAVPDYLNQVTQPSTNTDNSHNVSSSIPMVVDPIVIYTITDLQSIKNNLSANYVLGNDIDASEFALTPIGDPTNAFTGIFDGQGHTISNLTISEPTTGYVGLFGYINGGTIKNVGLVNESVTGSSHVGGLAGTDNFGTISQSYVIGNINGLAAVGGLVGASGATISDTYVVGTVDGGNEYGGLLGTNLGTVSESYSAASVTSTSGKNPIFGGGLIGVGTGTAVSSYWDTQVSGQSISDRGIGETTQELQSGTLPSGFDSNVWTATSGQYPALAWQSATVPTVTEALASDTGSSSSDKITSNPALTGTADASSTVTIKEGSTILGTAVADSTGVWTFNPILSDGIHTLVAHETNLAGNTGYASLTLTLDTTAPPKPTGLTLAPASDSGVQGDNITDVKTPVITGTGEVGDTVTLFDGLASIGTGTVLSDGTWSVTAAALLPGLHTLTATETDIAGNVSGTSIALDLTIIRLPQSDYKDDGNGDVLFQNDQTGQLIFVEMQGGTSLGTGLATGGVPGLVFGGHGDINGDGFTDIVEQDPAGGQILVGYQDGSGVPNWAQVADTPG